MAKLDNKYIEVGIRYGDLEFYHSFVYPANLLMRRYSKGSCIRIGVEDWLQSDFPTILAMRMHLLHPRRLELSYCSSFRPGTADLAPVAPGNSLPDSWLLPFIFLIAETFLNTFADEKK